MSRTFASRLLPLMVILCVAASTQAEESKGREVELMAPGSSYRYQLREASPPQLNYGAVIRHDIARARGEAKGKRPEPLGTSYPVPEGWPASAQGLPKEGKAPFAATEKGENCKCGTRLPNIEEKRSQVLYLSRELVVPEDAPLEDTMLELSLEYRDGLLLYLNGREILRRHLSPPVSPDEDVRTASRTRGPEWETVRLPVARSGLHPGRNRLSVELRPSRHRNGVRFDASLRLVPMGRLVRGPIVQRAGQGKALILFDTDVPMRAEVAYGGKDLEKSLASSGGSLARHHRVELSGLEAGSRVHYQLRGAGIESKAFEFHMPPESSEPLSFAIYGDVRGGHKAHAAIVGSLLAEAVDFVLVTGDLVLRGSDEGDWQRFFGVTEELLARLPYYPVAGNHDMGQAGEELRRLNEIFELWPAPAGRPAAAHWYSFDISGVHFVMLDSNLYEHEEQLLWLEGDLAAARKSGARAIVAATHAGPYSRGLHGGHSFALEHYVPILRKHKVDLLVSGHDHLYQRGRVDGLDYIVSGGGGAPLYPVKCGVKGKKSCRKKDGMKHVAREHHYLVVTVMPGYLRVCPKRSDGTPLESCLNLGKERQ